ncbi:MAG: hypothetical protein EXR21_01300 [Flavobacteriaceae bacterium]|nr:hypothetical protein [Flavobacteriaceae bacterium]
MDKKTVLIYGAYGFTGKRIAEQAKAMGLSVVLAGRDETLLAALAERMELPYRAFTLESVARVASQLEDVSVVIHAAGPFKYTFRNMVEACIQTRAHYLDISGEWSVFEELKKYTQAAVESGIMLLPGCGFDVVPSDCLAAYLHSKMPEATKLELAFCPVKGGWSGGTAKTMIEGMGDGGSIRENGSMKNVSLAYKKMQINFGPFEALSICIPWGDLSTAYTSTGIPNIEIYFGAGRAMWWQMLFANNMKWLFKKSWFKKFLLKQVDKRKARLESKAITPNGKTYLWGRISSGEATVAARLVTTNGYDFSAKASTYIAKQILAGNFKVGYQTPSLAYGYQLITDIEDCAIEDV